MQRQGSLAVAEYAGKKKQTRRDNFLAEMEPWCRGRSWWNGGDRYTRRAVAVRRQSGSSGCCGSILCSNGTPWLTKEGGALSPSCGG
jgi:hypothetical protein